MQSSVEMLMSRILLLFGMWQVIHNQLTIRQLIAFNMLVGRLRTQMGSSQSGFLRSGLPVKVKFDAYPFQDYGVTQGTVRWVSPDSKPSQSGTQVFDVEIELEQSYIQVGTKKMQLTPGQTATAEVIIRKRQVSDFLVDPFKKLQEGGVNF